MNQREAKELACWLAAGWIRAVHEGGADLHRMDGSGEVLDPDGADAVQVSAALAELIEELERRGAGRAKRA